MKSKIALLFVGFLVFTSCTDFYPFESADSKIGDIEDMNLEEVAVAIDREVGEAKANRAAHCDILPIGAKPCGGPWGYLVFSQQSASEATLKNLIERYNKLDEIRNIEEGRGSTCELAGEPDVTLKKGSCNGEGPYAWNPGDILERNGIEE